MRLNALRNRICFNSGGVGPMPLPVMDEMRHLEDLMLEYGGHDPAYRTVAESTFAQTRVAFAEELDAEPGEIALMRAVSECLSLLATALNLREGDEIITSDEEHPSGVTEWISARDAAGVVLKRVSVGRGPEVTIRQLREAITSRTRLIAVSHVTTETGIRLPMEEICALARERGVLTSIDGAQAAGQLPLDLRDSGPDFYVFPTFKWLLGPRGAAVFYLRAESLIRLGQPGAGAGAFERWSGADLSVTFWDDARRFEFGARSLELYAGAGAALRFAQESGVKNIERRVLQLAAELKQRLSRIPGVRVLTPGDPGESAGIVTFQVSGLQGADVSSRLYTEADVQCRPALEGRATRLCVHYFATAPEIELVVSAVEGLAAEGR